MKSPGGDGTPDFCVRSMTGERMKGWCGSVDTGRSGRPFLAEVPLYSIVRLQPLASSNESSATIRMELPCRASESKEMALSIYTA